MLDLRGDDPIQGLEFFFGVGNTGAGFGKHRAVIPISNCRQIKMLLQRTVERSAATVAYIRWLIAFATDSGDIVLTNCITGDTMTALLMFSI